MLLGAGVWVSLSSISGVPWVNYTTINVILPQVGNLLPEDPVRIAGVRVGQVHALVLAPNAEAEVQLWINPSTRLPTGTTVAVRAAGLLGARYIQLIPGRGPGRLRSGSTIDATNTSLTFGVPEALDTFDRPTRQQLGSLIRGIGTGLLGHGAQLNDAIHGATGAAPAFDHLAEAILARTGAARRLLPSIESTMKSLAAARTSYSDLLAPGAEALGPFLQQRSAVRQALTEAPQTLTDTKSGLDRGEALLNAAHSLATAALGTLPYAPASLNAATDLLHNSAPPLDRAAALLRTALPSVPDVLRITDAVKPLLPILATTLTRATPIVSQVGRYGCNIEYTAAVFRSMTGFGGGATGPNGVAQSFRLQALVSPENASIPVPALEVRDGYPLPCVGINQTFALPLARRGGRAP
jgi:phospholipid/cholesterol/gamma-HCH transport system substrate-binding protein